MCVRHNSFHNFFNLPQSEEVGWAMHRGVRIPLVVRRPLKSEAIIVCFIRNYTKLFEDQTRAETKAGGNPTQKPSQIELFIHIHYTNTNTSTLGKYDGNALMVRRYWVDDVITLKHFPSSLLHF